MANISVSESDFSALFEAANLAQESKRRKLALALDKLARKANAALSTAKTNRELPRWPGQRARKICWQEVPSTIDWS
jgi:hypothetical protein